MKFLGFENFIKGNGIWIIVGVLGAALIVSVVFLIINVVKLRKEKKAEVVDKEKQQEEVKEEPVAIEKVEEPVEEKKEAKKPVKKTTTKKAVKKEEQPKEAVALKEEKQEEPKTEVKQEKKATYGVTYDKENRQWVVKKTGATRASKRCSTKAEALEYAEKLSEANGANLRVHKKDGKFQKR